MFEGHVDPAAPQSDKFDKGVILLSLPLSHISYMNSCVTHVLGPAVAIGWNRTWREEINETVSVGVIAGAEKFEGKFPFLLLFSGLMECSIRFDSSETKEASLHRSIVLYKEALFQTLTGFY